MGWSKSGNFFGSEVLIKTKTGFAIGDNIYLLKQ